MIKHQNKDSIFNEREREFMFAICCRPSICRMSVVCNARAPTQAVVIFGNISTRVVPWPSTDIREKFYGVRLRGTLPSGELNTTGVAKYNDFGPIEGYISEMVQGGRKVSINH